MNRIRWTGFFWLVESCFQDRISVPSMLDDQSREPDGSSAGGSGGRGWGWGVGKHDAGAAHFLEFRRSCGERQGVESAKHRYKNNMRGPGAPVGFVNLRGFRSRPGYWGRTAEATFLVATIS